MTDRVTAGVRRIQKTRYDTIFDIINTVIMVLILVVTVYPLYFTIVASISEPVYVVQGDVWLLPKGFTLDAYSNIMKESKIWLGYRNVIINTFFGVLLNLVLTLPTAYVLSKKRLRGRTFLSWFFLFTMYFSGGLIPTYLIVKDLGLLNKPYTLIFLSGLSIYNMVVTRIFYQSSIPDEIYEAARVDGCSDFRQFFQIALPLSAPIIAVMTLYYGVSRWNDYFNPLIYITDNNYLPLQPVLRNILIQSQTMANQANSTGTMSEDQMAYIIRQAYLAESMKYSLIFIASAPLLIAYPFVQKHFVKGVMIGSLKG